MMLIREDIPNMVKPKGPEPAYSTVHAEGEGCSAEQIT